MKKIILILVTSLLSLKLFAPFGCMTLEDWKEVQKYIEKQRQLKALIVGMQCKETWHDSLSYKKGDPYKKVNKIGALGAFQFMPKTLKFLGYNGSISYFLNNQELQIKYMSKLIEHNLSVLKKESKKYKITPVNFIGKKRYNTHITLAGLIAASHLAGVGGVQKFLATGYNAKDLNKTSVKTYLTTFKDYKLEI